MAVSSSTTRADYTGNGVTAAFTIPFYFIDNSHVVVLRTEIATGVATTLALGTDYSLSGAGSPSGGTATLVVAPPSTVRLTVYRSVPFTQVYHYVTGDTFPAAAHETNLDLLCMEAQQLNEAIGRTLSLPIQTAGVSAVLPTPVANRFVAWNANATGLTNYDTNDLLTIAGSSGFSYSTFTGNGVTTGFTLSAAPGAVANTEVSVNGLRKTPGADYSVSGTTLTFTSAPAAAAVILARWGTTLGIGIPADTSVTRAKLGTSFAATVPDSTSVQASTSKATPVDADLVPLFDSAGSFVLKKLTWAGIKATLKTYLDTLYLVPATAPVSVRQTVLSGPVDSNGFAAFGGSTGSTTVTTSGTLKVVASAGGDVNYVGSITNPAWTGLSTNGNMYLYLDVTSAGVVTTGAVAVAPVYQWGGTYSTTNGQHTFNIQEHTLKVGNGSTATQCYRVFVGEVAVSGGVVTAIFWYALMGRYTSGLQSVPAAGVLLSLAHFIGSTPQITWVLQNVIAQGGYAVGDEVPLLQMENINGSIAHAVSSSPLAASASRSVAWYLNNKSTSAIFPITDANWRVKLYAWRAW